MKKGKPWIIPSNVDKLEYPRKKNATSPAD